MVSNVPTQTGLSPSLDQHLAALWPRRANRSLRLPLPVGAGIPWALSNQTQRSLL